MSTIINGSLIIKDNFNNVLIIQRKEKKGQPKFWSILTRNIKGKETIDKCLEKIAKDDLKGIIFNLAHFADFSINENELNSVYTGFIKESIVLHKDIRAIKWINKQLLDEYDFIDKDKEILSNYFSATK